MSKAAVTVLDRMAAVTRRSQNGCLEWTGAITTAGYGTLSIGNRTNYAHRLAFEFANGPIGDGLVIDHLCRNRRCVEPSHLEAVTRRTNNLRGIGAPAVHAAKTACIHGHTYTDDTTYVSPSGGRGCRICRTATRKAYRERTGR